MVKIEGDGNGFQLDYKTVSLFSLEILMRDARMCDAWASCLSPIPIVIFTFAPDPFRAAFSPTLALK